MVKQVQAIVLGGGPAGLACARALGQRGVETVVLERRDWPQDKVCGEGLMPVGLRTLERLQIPLPPGRDFAGIEYVLGERRVAADFAEGPGRVVRRTQLSQHLLAGLERLQPRVEVENVVLQGDWIEVSSNRGLWRCRLLVGADGLHSWLRRHLGWNRRPWPGWQRWGWRQHFAHSPWNGRVEVQLADGCEAYISPVSESEVGVAVLAPKGLTRDTWLSPFPQLRQRLASAPTLTPLQGLGPLWQSSARSWAPGLALVGDAAGYLDACTGEGLSLALQAAEALAARWDPSQPGLQRLAGYGRDLRRLTLAYQVVTLGLLWLRRHPSLSPWVLDLLQARPGLFQKLLSANQGLYPLPRLLPELLLAAGSLSCALPKG